MFVPLTHIGVKGWIFNLVCPGNAMSVTHEGLLLLKTATVNRNLSFDEVCKEKHVFVAFKQFGGSFWLDIDMKKISYVIKGKSYRILGGAEMRRYPVDIVVDWWQVAHQWEIEETFFKNNNINPIWCIDLTGSNAKGTLNYTTGQWSGMIGMIQRDEVDYAIMLGHVASYKNSKVTGFSPATDYYPAHWITRYPLQLSPTWNLFGLFTKEN